MSAILLGVDTGGTFTDFVLYRDGRLVSHKVLSTPDAPEQAIIQGVKDLGLIGQRFIMTHGSTVATNALLERKGARTAYIANKGLKDVLLIGRQARKSLYDLNNTADAPVVERDACFEVPVRRDADGQVLLPLQSTDVDALKNQIAAFAPESIAINLLFSYVNAEDEKALCEALSGHYFVSCSHEVLPEIREYERGVATYLNAYVQPKLNHYLQNLAGSLPTAQVSVMQSYGGCSDAETAAQRGVNMLLSGPAGGLMGAKANGDLIGESRILTFDMGGTSTDVSIIDGEIKITSEGRIGGLPVAVPMVDMHTIGAGGGSIASCDSGGVLQVGPESAGAKPGPACYGQGGVAATVTDANLVLGRILPGAFLGGAMKLDRDAAEQSVLQLAQKMGLSMRETALGILEVANEAMYKALRVMSVERGYDPNDFVLMPFGGAAGLHACAIADKLSVAKIVVPYNAGVLSAFGMLVAPQRRVYTQSTACSDADLDVIDVVIDNLKQKAANDFADAGHSIAEIQLALDVRYAGQTHALSVPWQRGEEIKAQFAQLYAQRYSHVMSQDIEIVGVRVTASGSEPEIEPVATETNKVEVDQVNKVNDSYCDHSVRVVPREHISHSDVVSGPAIVTEKVATTWIAPGWRAVKVESGALLITRER